MKIVETILDTATLNKRLVELSKQHGGAWVFSIMPFSHETRFYQYKSPSKVPDHFYDLTRGIGAYPEGRIGYKGKMVGFTKAAIIREQQRGWGDNPKRRTDMRNPLTPREYKRRITDAETEVERGKHLVKTDPHKAEEHAYWALGILEHLDKELPASISFEKRGVISSLRRMAQIIIDRADYLQGKKVKRNPYGRNAMKSSGKRPISTKAISIRPISIGRISDVAELLNLPTSDDFQEDWWESISTMSYEAMSQADEEDIEEAGGEDEYRMEIEEELTNELYDHYKSAIEFVLEDILNDVDAKYEQVKGRYQIVPQVDWRAVAREVMEIINGIGIVYAGQDVEEFLEISAYTNYRDLVKAHLGYLKRRPSVYGGPSLESLYYGQMEYVRL